MALSNRNAQRSFATLLKDTRKRAGMTQKQLADLCTVSVRAIRDLELARTRSPRRETVRLLADALHLSDARRAELEESAAGPASWESYVDELAPPAPFAPMVARQHDVTTLVGLLKFGGHRLITLVGVPGVGKTRLAQEVATVLHTTGNLPVVWAHSGRSADRLPEDSLGRRVAGLFAGEPELDGLIACLGDRELLLVVDGKELKPSTRTALHVLLQRCPGLRLLHESRDVDVDPNGIEYPVFPLAVAECREDSMDRDAPRTPALQLMLSHCGRFGADFESDPESLAALAGICWFLDGIPHAMERAASWLLLYEPIQLVEVATRSPLTLSTSPSGSGSDLPESLACIIDSLRPPDADILRRLAPIRQPWTAAWATGFLGGSPVNSLSGLHLLCARGLIRPAGISSSREPQFTVLNLVRHLLEEYNADDRRLRQLSSGCG
jgi:transcriptional regulator with XRE-family HTH domain